MDNTTKKVPSRTIKPLSLNYCKMTKEKFAGLVKDIKSITEETYKSKLTVEIEIEGFDEPFTGTDILNSTLTTSEWSGLKYIVVDFSLEGGYSPAIKLQLGRKWYGDKAGLEIDILKGDTTDKLAVRESIRLRLSDFERKVWVPDKVVGLIAGILAVTLYLYIVVDPSSAKDSSSTEFFGVLTAAILGLWTAVGANKAYVYLLPHVEFLEDDKTTRWSKFRKFFWGVIAILGIVLAYIYRK